jgi:hypothetical protein
MGFIASSTVILGRKLHAEAEKRVEKLDKRTN